MKMGSQSDTTTSLSLEADDELSNCSNTDPTCRSIIKEDERIVKRGIVQMSENFLHLPTLIDFQSNFESCVND